MKTDILFMSGAIAALQAVETLLLTSDKSLTNEDVFHFIQDFKDGLAHQISQMPTQGGA